MSQAPDPTLWEEEPAGAGSTRPRRGPAVPYPCTEILEHLARHPEQDNPLLRRYVETQRSPRPCQPSLLGGAR